MAGRGGKRKEEISSHNNTYYYYNIYILSLAAVPTLLEKPFPFPYRPNGREGEKEGKRGGGEKK